MPSGFDGDGFGFPNRCCGGFGTPFGGGNIGLLGLLGLLGLAGLGGLGGLRGLGGLGCGGFRFPCGCGFRRFFW